MLRINKVEGGGRHRNRWNKINISYSKNKSMTSLIAPCWTSSFSADSLPIVNKTDMNSTI